MILQVTKDVFAWQSHRVAELARAVVSVARTTPWPDLYTLADRSDTSSSSFSRERDKRSCCDTMMYAYGVSRRWQSSCCKLVVGCFRIAWIALWLRSFRNAFSTQKNSRRSLPACYSVSGGSRFTLSSVHGHRNRRPTASTTSRPRC